MGKKSDAKIVMGIDFFLSIIIFIIGFFIMTLGLSYNDYINQIYSNFGSNPGIFDPVIVLSKTPIIVLVFGVLIIIYGLKRAIDDLLKLLQKN